MAIHVLSHPLFIPLAMFLFGTLITHSDSAATVQSSMAKFTKVAEFQSIAWSDYQLIVLIIYLS